MISPLDSASARLWWSNAVYVSGAALTLLAAMLVFIERRLIAAGIRKRKILITEFIAVGAAIISLTGTIGAIHYSNLVSHLKDIDLDAYKTSAIVQISQANKSAATANQKAQQAREVAAKVEQENTVLGGSVAKNAYAARKAEADLAKANKETSDFAHALALQHGIMAEQAKVSPELTPYQIQALSRLLKPYAGQDVALHTTAETVVRRLGAEIKMAFNSAGITTKDYSDDIDALYQGVSVVVHDPNNVPPIANALIMGFRQAGVNVHPVSAPQMVSAGQVGIFIGPN